MTTVWHLDAKCLRDNKPPAFFFPNLHGLSGPGRAVILRQIGEYCQGCPVRLECRDAGKGEDHGAWGGAVRDVEIAAFRLAHRRERAAG